MSKILENINMMLASRQPSKSETNPNEQTAATYSNLKYDLAMALPDRFKVVVDSDVIPRASKGAYIFDLSLNTNLKKPGPKNPTEAQMRANVIA